MGLSAILLLSYQIYYVIEIIMLHRTTTISNNYKYSVLQQPKNPFTPNSMLQNEGYTTTQ